MKSAANCSISGSAKLFLAAVVGVLLTGCADPNTFLMMGLLNPSDKREDSPPKLICSDGVAKLEKNDVGIVGGKTLHKDSWLAKGIVFIVQEYEENNVRKTSMCTGSLVDQNIVLTAAHCVDKAKYSYHKDIRVYFSNQPECDKESGQLKNVRREVDAMKIHGNWRSKGHPDHGKFQAVRGDVALLRLSEKAPADFYPLKLSEDFIDMKASSNILLAGYGQTNVDYEGKYSLDNEGVLLRMTQTNPLPAPMRAKVMQMIAETAKQIEARTLSGDDLIVTDNKAYNDVVFLDQSRGTGACAGDSGGPSLMKNQKGMFVVTGIASFVMHPTNKREACGYAAAYSSVSYYKDWIDDNFKLIKNADSAKEHLFEH